MFQAKQQQRKNKETHKIERDRKGEKHGQWNLKCMQTHAKSRAIKLYERQKNGEKEMWRRYA